MYPGASPYPPAAPPAATPPPPAEEKKKKFGGVGGKVRDAAAGGLGFGVGEYLGVTLIEFATHCFLSRQVLLLDPVSSMLFFDYLLCVSNGHIIQYIS